MRPQSAPATDEEREVPDLEHSPSPRNSKRKGKGKVRRATDVMEVDSEEAEPSQTQPIQRTRRSTRQKD